MDSVTQKKCSKCKEWKIQSLFPKNKHTKDGLGSWCKWCTKEKSKEWQRSNPEKYRESQQRWRKANPEKNRARIRAWYIANTEKYLEATRNWHRNNIERVREKSRERARAHPEKSLEKNRNRRALKKGNGGNITAKEWQELKDFYNNTCLCCKRNDVKLTLDHVIPLKLGGRNSIENAQPLCLLCNSSKGAKLIDYRPNLWQKL